MAARKRFFNLASSAFSSIRRNFGKETGILQNQRNRKTVGNRYSHFDRDGYTHFKARGPSSWVSPGGSVPKVAIVVIGAIGGFFTIVYITHVEYVPYTNRKHLVLVTPQTEVMLGERTFNQLKQQFKAKMLPPYHPAVIKVSNIAKNVIKAAVDGVEVGSDVELNYSDGIPRQPKSRPSDEWEGESLPGPKHMNKEIYSDRDQTVDDVWVEKSRDYGLSKARRVSIDHVKLFKWEIVVVDSDMVNAMCLPGGKIIVFTGILKAFPDEAEVACVIGHEVAHALSRHTAEQLTRTIFIGFLELLMLTIVQVPDIIGTASTLLLRLPFSRKMEMEADHVGVLIMAAAGYNPRVSPGVYLKLGELNKLPELAHYVSTHPSGKQRAQALIKSSAMQQAIKLYESRVTGWNYMGYLL